jgi:hypothetical protein
MRAKILGEVERVAYSGTPAAVPENLYDAAAKRVVEVESARLAAKPRTYRDVLIEQRFGKPPAPPAAPPAPAEPTAAERNATLAQEEAELTARYMQDRERLVAIQKERAALKKSGT